MSDYKEFIGAFNETPVEIFEQWFKAAVEKEENGAAFVLSTVDTEGVPNARTLLLKGFDSHRPFFFSNYTSVKGQEIEANSNVAMTFYWHRLGKQVRVRGKAVKCSLELSRDYFHSRGKESQIASLTSSQSKPISSRKKLEDEFQANVLRYNDQEIIPHPQEWGGYMIDVEEITFFIYGEHRLNDRFQFIKKGQEWESLRLYP